MVGWIPHIWGYTRNTEVVIFLTVLCQERKRLLSEYQDATKLHYEAVRTLVEEISGTLGSDLDFLRRNCRNAWERAEQARLTLYRHEINHVCDRQNWVGSKVGVRGDSGGI